MDVSSRPYQLLFEEQPGYLHVLVCLQTMTVEITREYLTGITEAIELGVLIANNRGALFQLFNNTADAEDWLLGS
jgi:hypothetical protein